jgi:hypothetical protein
MQKKCIVFIDYTEEKLRNDVQALELKASQRFKEVVGDKDDFYQFKICGTNEHGSLGL